MTSAPVPPTLAEERNRQGGSEGFFTCFSKSAPYQALHDWLPLRSPRVPVGTKKGGGGERDELHAEWEELHPKLP